MSTVSYNPRVAAITVAFNPSASRLAEQVSALRAQVGHVVIVDNGSDDPAPIRALAVSRSDGLAAVEVVSLAQNYGVASGFNQGAAAASRRECDYLLLLDHDSLPEPGMVAALLEAHREAATHGPVAAVGPRVRDARDHHEFGFIRLGWTHNRRVHCASPGGVVPCDFLITSGSLIPAPVFERVGGLDPALFIDFVDLDWCCRARAMGYALYGACAARMDHELGEAPRRIWGRSRMMVHSPQRLYYMTRNRLLLYRRAHIPLKWKVKDVPRGALKILVSILLVPPRAAYARMALAALRDGARGRSGPKP